MVAFAKEDTTEIAKRLQRPHVDIAVYPHRIRISPSVYNPLSQFASVMMSSGLELTKDGFSRSKSSSKSSGNASLPAGTSAIPIGNSRRTKRLA
jgi:hypothetical protein